MQELQQISSLIQAGGVLLLLVGAIVGIFRDWWVTGVEHRRQLAAKDVEIKFWKDIALRGMNIAASATSTTEALTSTATSPVLTAREAEIARRVASEMREGG